jgi:hypothetical protein
MAKTGIADEEKVQEQLLEALRQAVDGAPHRLQGAGKNAGLFPSGKAGEKVIERARAGGFLKEVPSPEPPAGKSKAKPPVYVVLTDRGRQFLLDQESPLRLLGGLREQLEAQGTALAEGVRDAQTQLSSCRESVHQLEKKLDAQFDHYQQTVQVLRAALDRISHQPAAPALPLPGGSTTGWLDEVVPFVTAQKRLNSFDRPNLKRVYEHLKQTHPALTLGEFHEGLRTLHQQRRIRLDPYTQALATLQDPLHALYLDREVKYYVDLP